MQYDMLVNRENTLDPSYYPSDLVNTNTRVKNHIDSNHKVLLVNVVFDAFCEMRHDASKLGYDIDINSGYRSYEYQQDILKYFVEKDGVVAYKHVAAPGTSEHQTGLAIDFCMFLDKEDSEMETKRENILKWVHNNCYRYGFIVRYPKEKENITKYIYEPYHLRYVGIELAEELSLRGLTLEEYHAREKIDIK